MYVYNIHIRNKEIFCVCGYLQQTAFEPFMELCFEADK